MTCLYSYYSLTALIYILNLRRNKKKLFELSPKPFIVQTLHQRIGQQFLHYHGRRTIGVLLA